MTLPSILNPNKTLPQGYIVRPVELRDLEAALNLFNAHTQKLYGQDEYVLIDLETEWTLPDFDLATSTLAVFTAEGQMIGYVEVSDLQDPPVYPWVWSRVHPEYEERGIDHYLMSWAEQRCGRVLERVPSDARVAIRTGVTQENKSAQRLFEELGYKEHRYSWRMLIEMNEAPPAPKLPAGMSIRSMAYPAELEKVIRAVDEAFSDHYGYIQQSMSVMLERWQHWINGDPDFDPSVWFMVIDEASGEIAGMSLCWHRAQDDPNRAYVSTLGVRRAWRKQGLGLALLHHTFGEYWARGQKRVGLHVDASSLTGATRLYERAGMHVDRQYITYEKLLRDGIELTTVSVAD